MAHDYPLRNVPRAVRSDLGKHLQYQRNPKHNAWHLVDKLYTTDTKKELDQTRLKRYKSKNPGEELVEDLSVHDNPPLTVQKLIDVLNEVQHYKALAVLRPEEIPSFFEQPNALVVSAGKPASLCCKVHAKPPPTVRWYKKAAGGGWKKLQVDGGARVSTKQDDGCDGIVSVSLNLEQVDSGDDADYCCRAKNRVGMVFSRGARIMVVRQAEKGSLLRAVVQPPDIVCLMGEWKVLTCYVNSNLRDKVSYQWYHDNKQLYGEVGVNLSIRGVTDMEIGKYYCQVTDSDGTSIDSTTATVSLLDRPTIKAEPKDTLKKLELGERLDLVVEANDKPVEYLWHHDGIPLLMSQRSDGCLCINSVSLVDAGVYYCVVSRPSSNLSTRSRDVVVQVGEGSASLVSEETSMLQAGVGPEITRHPENTEVKVGEKLQLFCTVADASSYPRPSYQWYKDKRMITDAENSCVFVKQTCVERDEGRYRCEVHRYGQSKFSNEATVKVRRRELIEIKGSLPRRLPLLAGDTGELTCKVTDKGRDYIFQWFRDGHPVNMDSNLARCSEMPEDGGECSSTLVMPNVTRDNNGKYWCRVTDPAEQCAYMGDYYECTSTITVDVREAKTPEKQDKPHRREASEHANGASQGEAKAYTEQQTSEDLQKEEAVDIRSTNPYFFAHDSSVRKKNIAEVQDIVEDQDSNFKLALSKGRPSYFAKAKLAVLIGNKDLGLKCVEADTILLRKRLEELGFEVLSFLNLAKDEMDNVVKLTDCLARELKGLYIVFFYAGHGFRCDEEDFLQGYDFCYKDWENTALRVQKLEQSLLCMPARMLTVILDCCRSVFCGDSDGTLGHITLPGVANLTKVFSCLPRRKAAEPPGGMADHSVFVGLLEKLLKTRGHEPMNDMFINLTKEMEDYCQVNNKPPPPQVPDLLFRCSKPQTLADPVLFSDKLDKFQNFIKNGIHGIPRCPELVLEADRDLQFSYQVCFASYTSNCWLMFVRLNSVPPGKKVTVVIKSVAGLDYHGCSQVAGSKLHHTWIVKNIDKQHTIARDNGGIVSCRLLEKIQHLKHRSLISPQSSHEDEKSFSGKDYKDMDDDKRSLRSVASEEDQVVLRFDLNFFIKSAKQDSGRTKLPVKPYQVECGHLLWAKVTGIQQLVKEFHYYYNMKY